MSSTLATLRIAVRRLIDETDSSNSSYGDSELNDYLNQSARKVASLLEWPVAIYTTNSVQDQALYTLPAGFLFLVELHFDGVKLDLVDRVDMEALFPEWQNGDSGEPVIAYRAENSVFGVYQKPDSSNAAKTIEAHCIKLPADLSADADIPDLHEILQDCMPFRAAVLAQIRAGNYKAAGFLENLFDKEIASAKARVNKFAEELIALRWG